MPFRLFDLANELVIDIIDYLADDRPTLRALQQSCRRLQSLAEPLRYRSHFLRGPEKIEWLLDALNYRPQRANHVKSLELRGKRSRAGASEDFGGLITLLGQCNKLQSFTFESPYANYQMRAEDESEDFNAVVREFWSFIQRASMLHLKAGESGPSGPLQDLRRLEVHLHGEGSRYLNLGGEASHVFTHPTIESLTISCATIRAPVHMAGTSEYTGNTPLKRLSLIECDTSIGALYHILSAPRGLEYLQIGEPVHHSVNDDLGRNLCDREPQRFFEALAFQQHSLQELRYDCDRDEESVAVASRTHVEGLRGLEKLHSIQLSGFHSERLGDALWKDPPAEDSAPVRTVTINRRRWVGKAPWGAAQTTFPSWVRGIKAARAQLEELHIIEAEECDDKVDLADMTHDELVDLHKELERQALRLTIFRTDHTFSSVFPPYLYGEWPPEPKIMYNSSAGCEWLKEDDDVVEYDMDEEADPFD